MRTTLEREEQQTDTEITLGMTSLLGIFFGLVLICGIFFGLGYSLGRGSSSHAPAGASAAIPEADASSPTAANHLPKPSAESGANEPLTSSPSAADQASSASAEDSSSVTVPTDSEATQTAPSRATPAPAIRPVPQPVSVDSSAPPRPAPAKAPAVVPAVTSTTPATGASSVMVQIAAISRQEDADVLVAALKRHGYNATERSESQDKLLHVQVGPFASRSEANTMRTKLLADGYNAIIK